MFLLNNDDKEIEENDNGNGPEEQGFLSKLSLFFLELIKVAILAGITIFLVRYFLFKPFYVKGQSMEPSYHENNYLIIDELTYRFRPPERGEVVVFKSPVSNDYYLKRVIGLPGERIKVDNNKVIIYNEANPQGVLLSESYLNEKTEGSIMVTLTASEYFVLGDNRLASYDSRRFGPISKSAIIGRVWLRGWPLNQAGLSVEPNYNI